MEGTKTIIKTVVNCFVAFKRVYESNVLKTKQRNKYELIREK